MHAYLDDVVISGLILVLGTFTSSFAMVELVVDWAPRQHQYIQDSLPDGTIAAAPSIHSPTPEDA